MKEIKPVSGGLVDREVQMFFAGQEELIKRKNFLYLIKGKLNRRFGLFDKWAKSEMDYYRKKYPSIYERLKEK